MELLSEADREWRKNLKVDDHIDIEKHDPTFGITVWGEGIV